MALIILRRGARVLSYVSTHVQLRSFTWQSRLSIPLKNAFTCRRPCIYHDCRNISLLCNPLHCMGAAATEVSHTEVSRPRHTYLKSSSQFLKYFNELLPADVALENKKAFILIKSCGKRMWTESPATRNELVKYVWTELEKNGVRLETSLWNTLLSVYIENRYDFEPLDFLKEMWQKSNSEPINTTFQLLIQSYALKGDPVGAMKIVEFMLTNEEKITESTYGWLIRAFAKSGDMDGVNEIFNSMRKNNVKPSQVVYEQLINAHAENGDLDSIGKVIEEMVNQEVFPTTSTYINIIGELASAGHANIIDQVWKKIDGNENLIVEGIKPLIQECMVRGDYESAFILKKISVKKTTENNSNYYKYIERSLFFTLKFLQKKDINEYHKISAAVEHHLNEPLLSRRKNLFEFLASYDSEYDPYEVVKSSLAEGEHMSTRRDFLPLFNGYAKTDNIRSIVQLYQLMIESGLKCDSQCHHVIYSAVKDSHGTCSVPLLFLSIITDKGDNSVSNKSDKSIVQDASSRYDLYVSLDEIKNNLLTEFNLAVVTDVVTHIHDNGINVSNLIGEITKHLVLKGNVEVYLAFMKGMVKNNMPVISRTYNTLLMMLNKMGYTDEFFSFIRFMKEHGVDPDQYTYFEMLKMAATTGKYMVAQFCFEKLEADKFTLGKAYNYLILAYRKGGDTDSSKTSANAIQIIHLFNEMVEKGYEPSKYTVATVISRYLLLQNIEGANEIIERYSGEMPEVINIALLKSYVARKDLDAAEKLFDEMKASSTVTVKVGHYNEMFVLFYNSGSAKKAGELYQEMLSSGIQPNAFTYTKLIWTFLHANDPVPCIGFLEQSLALGLNHKVGIFVELLNCLVLTGNVENVEKVIELIKQQHSTRVEPVRLEMAHILVNVKAGNLEEASTLLHHTEVSEDLISYRFNRVANTAVEKQDTQLINNLIVFFKTNNYDYKDLDVYYMMALNKSGDVDGVKSFYAERINAGGKFNDKFISLYDVITQEHGIKESE